MNEDTKPMVCMIKKTGELFLGWRVSFLGGAETWVVGVLKQDGWVCELPKEVSPYAIYFNMKSEEWFEVLSEL